VAVALRGIKVAQKFSSNFKLLRRSSQVPQLVSASSVSVANFLHGFIDFCLAFLIVIPLLYGAIAGVQIVHRIPTGYLKHAAAVLCRLSAS
jgi:uncharacterized membrane protein YfcA